MKLLTLVICLVLPAVTLGGNLYKCTVDGAAKYQASPCDGKLDTAPLDLNEPSPELKEKIHQQALEKEWEKQEAARQKAEAERAERDRQLEEQIKLEQLNYYRNSERDRQEAKAREQAQLEKAEREKFEWRCENHQIRRDHFSECDNYLKNKRWTIPWENQTNF